jgi:hypothetical protein
LVENACQVFTKACIGCFSRQVQHHWHCTAFLYVLFVRGSQSRPLQLPPFRFRSKKFSIA